MNISLTSQEFTRISIETQKLAILLLSHRSYLENSSPQSHFCCWEKGKRILAPEKCWHWEDG